MAKDFRASQIQTTQIVASGSSSTNARIVVYSVENQSTVTPNQGIIDSGKFVTSSIGNDIFLYVSGAVNGKDSSGASIAAFGGDVHISGNLTVDGSSPGGGGSDADWTDNGTELRTTSSVAINTDGQFASSYGADVYFYVSGTFGSGSASDKIALFGGDVKVSGTLAVGSGSAFIQDDRITLTSASMRNVGGNLTFFDNNNLAGYTLTQLAGGSGNTIWDSDVADLAFTTGSIEVTGSALIKGGITGSITKLTDGSDYLIAGTNITLSTGSGGAITINAVTGSAGAAGSTNEIQYNLAGVLSASSNFWINPGLSVNVTGTVIASTGFSGSLTTLADGSSYLLAGTNITLVTNSQGQVTITSTATGGSGSGSGAGLGLIGITDYASTVNTSSSPEAVGQINFDSSLYTSPFYLNAVLTATSASVSASIKLLNLDDQAFVEIGGSGITQINHVGTTSTNVASVNLAGAANFNATSGSVYELQLFTSDETVPVTVGSAFFYVTASVTASSHPSRLSLGSYTTTTATSSNPEGVGGGYFLPTEHETSICTFRPILATATGSNIAYVQLFNVTSGALVHIGGAGITELSSSTTKPVPIDSVNLFSATNFNASSGSVYEVRIYGSGSTSPLAVLVNSELICS